MHISVPLVHVSVPLVSYWCTMSVLPGSVNEEDLDDDLDAALETVLNVVSSLRLEHIQRQWCRNGPHSAQFICRVRLAAIFRSRKNPSFEAGTLPFDAS